MKRKTPRECYVVEAHCQSDNQAAALKPLLRKSVSFSGGGGKWSVDIGWSFATRRAANAARERLGRVRGVSTDLYDLGARA